MAVDHEGYAILKRSRGFDKKLLMPSLRGEVKPIDWFTDAELMALPTGSVFVFDVETYVNFFYVAYKEVISGKVVAFEQSPGCAFDNRKLQWMLWRFCFVGFNSINYDIPMITLALRDADTVKLKEASDAIIFRSLRAYQFEQEFKIKMPALNHIDLIEVAPLQASLKTYAGRLHCERMQDLPIDPNEPLTEEDAEVTRYYCANDLDNTKLLFNELKPHIELRESMGKDYGVELRSKSDAQVAEAVINSELAKLGTFPRKPTIKDYGALRYKLPDFVKFSTPALQELLSKIVAAEFTLSVNGKPMWPKGLGEIEDKKAKEKVYVLKIKIGNSVYKLGMGGLHSQEENVSYVAGPDEVLADNDVESFYPRILLNQGLFPAHLGEAFLKVYEMLVNKRLNAKHNKLKIIADALKIVINGSFGKLGNKYSTLYSPQLMLQVTITGQLVLLMLIERLNNVGINVISGNTDGIVSYYNSSRHAEVRQVIAKWEVDTSFKTEETRYSGVYSRDVNNYIAVKLDGGDEKSKWFDERLGCKTKGVYCERGSALNSPLSKNPETLICSDAVQAYIKSGVPIAETIQACQDIRRFVSVRNVKGGAEKGGRYLGKTVRWYYAKLEAGCINYVMTGNKVAKTDGGKPLMDLPPSLPSDIDYAWYVKEATDVLFDIGVLKKARQPLFF